MSQKHSKFSASSSSKWLNCPGSVLAEKSYKNVSSAFADEGSLVHYIIGECLEKGLEPETFLKKTFKDICSEPVNSEMVLHANDYIDYVNSFRKKGCDFLVEQKVDYSNYVIGGFGTVDTAIINDDEGICHVIDFKYGQGVQVDVFENSQLMLYALGILNENFLSEIKTFVLHIFQPRKNNISSWEVSTKNLTLFGEYCTERVKLALSDNPKRIPGSKQCKFCRAAGDCKELMEFSNKTLLGGFENYDEVASGVLTYEHKKGILDNSDLIKHFLKSVRDNVMDDMLSGKEFKGYKIVETRSVRKWDADAIIHLKKLIGDKSFKKSIIGIGEAEKILGKDKKHLINKFAHKGQGNKTLAKESDKRPNVLYHVQNDFEII